MARRFHVNKKTGEVDVCRAETKCPFGDMETEHFNSKWDAEAYYEELMAHSKIPNVLTKNTSNNQNSQNISSSSNIFNNDLEKILNGNENYIKNDEELEEAFNIFHSLDLNKDEEVIEALKIVHSSGSYLNGKINQNNVKIEKDIQIYFNTGMAGYDLITAKQESIRNSLSDYINFNEATIDYKTSFNISIPKNLKSIFINNTDEFINDSLKVLPKNWVDKYNKKVTVVFDSYEGEGLGSYSKSNHTFSVNVPKNPPTKANHLKFKRNSTHELSHLFIENNYPDINKFSQKESLLRVRHNGVIEEQYFDEVYGLNLYRDNFGDTYSSNDYGDIHKIGREYFTVGIERLFWNREDAWNLKNKQDILQNDFTVGVLFLYGRR